jgi:hypothetical protein
MDNTHERRFPGCFYFLLLLLLILLNSCTLVSSPRREVPGLLAAKNEFTTHLLITFPFTDA